MKTLIGVFMLAGTSGVGKTETAPALADALYGGEQNLITINMCEYQEAHSDVHEMFFQVFDKGFMEDGEGRFIDFKNTLILLSTNAGTELIASMCKDSDLLPEPEGLPRRCASRC